MDESDYHGQKIDPRQRDDSDRGFRIGTVMVVLVLIVVSIVVLNRMFMTVDDTENPDIYIPDYGVGEFIEYVSDGDTFKTVENDRVRLLGINTEETGMPHANAAKQKLEELLTHGEIKLERDIEDKDRYGRSLRYVFAGDTFVNLELVRLGYAHVYVIEPNTKYWDELKAAEQEAIANGLVLWQLSSFDVTITTFQPKQASSSGTGLNVERIVFKNNGTVAIDMTDWTLKDEATHIFKFDQITLDPGSSLEVHSGQGTDTATDIYWGTDGSIWNNAGDVSFLRDENGLLVVSWRYTEVNGSYVWEKH